MLFYPTHPEISLGSHKSDNSFSMLALIFSEGWAFLVVAVEIKGSYRWNIENSKDRVVYILLNQNQDR